MTNNPNTPNVARSKYNDLLIEMGKSACDLVDQIVNDKLVTFKRQLLKMTQDCENAVASGVGAETEHLQKLKDFSDMLSKIKIEKINRV